MMLLALGLFLRLQCCNHFFVSVQEESAHIWIDKACVDTELFVTDVVCS